MRLISNYPRQLVLPSPITIIATSTAAPALPKRADQPAICHGQGCLSIPGPPPPATTTPPPAAPTPRDNTGPVTVTESVTIHIWTTIISWRTAYDTVVAVTSFNTIATSMNTVTQPVTLTEKVDVTIPVTVTAPAPTLAQTPHTPEPVQGKKALQTGDIIAIVLAVIIVILLGVMYFLTRRFYRMYRAERVLRKQVQTEGTELRQGVGNGGAGAGAGAGFPADVKDKAEWEKLDD